MVIKNYIMKESYYDSVLLMRLAGEAGKLPGVSNISVGMGTPLNKDTIQELGLLLPEGEKATPNDLIIALSAETDETAEKIRASFLQMLKDNQSPKGKRSYPSLDSMKTAVRDRNLAVISLAGQYAAAEAEKALKMGMNVFMFSDNVPIEEEVKLKTYAREQGLLMMGPDCGLSFIGGVAVGLCSKVRRGGVGLIGACGSGMQEVMNIVHLLGGGVSQAIGVGGRDLRREVGGLTMLTALDLLEADEETKVIGLISKPPDPETAEKIFDRVRHCKKPVVAQFIHCDPTLAAQSGAQVSNSFEETALRCLAILKEKEYIPEAEQDRLNRLLPLAKEEAAGMAKSQKYLRGLYCGGSLAEETITLGTGLLGSMYGNVAFQEEYMLSDPHQSKGNCLIDLGAEEFTLGKPHVAIDPSPRLSRFVQEARDPETAVILMDFLLGYALCEDPAGMIAPLIKEEKARALQEGRKLSVVAAFCGSDLDPQNRIAQEKILRDAGAIVMGNNGEASRLAALIASVQGGKNE
ncbi:MAG: acyl-CoA synthetase FdrA [Clostridia bacterium]|nr:acyl-CoA synthetase FdrA [Clostridia bacterium]